MTAFIATATGGCCPGTFTRRQKLPSGEHTQCGLPRGRQPLQIRFPFGHFKRPTQQNRQGGGIAPFIAAAATQGESQRLSPELDDELSNRWLDLDPAGYFLIKIDRENNTIVAEHYTNTISSNGVACDPDTGKPIPCTPGYVRPPSAIYTGRSAKELSVKIIEEPEEPPLTMLVHANYLGREFQRAEEALISGAVYVQD